MSPHSSSSRNILITGGAGFIGSNLAERLLLDPTAQVCILDDLSRRGVAHNLAWLRTLPSSDRLAFVHGDIRNQAVVVAAVSNATEIYHLAAQVAVTTSVERPRDDFEVNVLGTFNVLEAARASGRRPFMLFTSTNKVYGSLHRVPVVREGTRYRAEDITFRGVAEYEALDFHSPYGCSKGAADQYVRDYSRIYDLPTVVFRMSCVAGPRQFGTEDQGWVAHFLYSVLERKPVTIYGDGYQVRDVLHVDDLLDAIESARRHNERTSGQIYNVGGGPDRTASVVDVLAMITRLTSVEAVVRHSKIRPGDQPLYVSDTHKLTADTGWRARRSLRETLEAIQQFWLDNRTFLDTHRGRRLAEDLDSLDPDLFAPEPVAGDLIAQEVA